MFIYQVRMALKSLRRNPVLSGLMIGAIALGIGVSTTFVAAHYLLSMNPVPDRSERLFALVNDRGHVYFSLKALIVSMCSFQFRY